MLCFDIAVSFRSNGVEELLRDNVKVETVSVSFVFVDVALIDVILVVAVCDTVELNPDGVVVVSIESIADDDGFGV